MPKTLLARSCTDAGAELSDHRDRWLLACVPEPVRHAQVRYLKRVCREPVVLGAKAIGKLDLGQAADSPTPWTPEPAA